MAERHHYKRSRLHRLGVGRWVCGDDGGLALKGAPSRVNGLFLNTPWGLFGVTVPRRPRTQENTDCGWPDCTASKVDHNLSPQSYNHVYRTPASTDPRPFGKDTCGICAGRFSVGDHTDGHCVTIGAWWKDEEPS